VFFEQNLEELPKQEPLLWSFVLTYGLLFGVVIAAFGFNFFNINKGALYANFP
jgi:hypothetical protein